MKKTIALTLTMAILLMHFASITVFADEEILGSLSATFNDTYGDLDVLGWQVMKGVPASEYKTSLIFKSNTVTKAVPLELSDTTQANVTKANNTYNDSVDYWKSKFNLSISYEQLKEVLPNGVYTLGILIEAKGKKQYNEYDKYFTMDDTINMVDNADDLLLQEEMDKRLEKEFNSQYYSFDEPFIVQNPYQVSPLTAIVGFKTDGKGYVTVEVIGKDESTNITHEFTQLERTHLIPIYGLYPDYNNEVTITFNGVDGEVLTNTIYLQTDPLPATMQQAEVVTSNPDLLTDELTIVSSQYLTAYDKNGDVRWYILDSFVLSQISPVEKLANGNIAVYNTKMVRSMYYMTGFYEIDMLGKVHTDFLIDGAHHDFVELSNGDFIVCAEKDKVTTEDYVVRIDRQTGDVVQSWDLQEIFSELGDTSDPTYMNRTYMDRQLFMPNAPDEAVQEAAKHLYTHDWLHNNSVWYDESNDTMILSNRQKDLVVEINAKTNAINWMLTDPTAEWASNYSDKILTPIGEDFEYSYGQHAVQKLENGDIILYDNGNFRSKTIEEQVPATDNYSRAVVYRIDQKNMTVEQIYQYGKERGSELFTTYIGDADYIGENHYLITFGGVILSKSGQSAESPMDLFANIGEYFGETFVVEVKDGEVISELRLHGILIANSYRSEKIYLYNPNQSYVDFSIRGTRLGTGRELETLTDIVIPEENSMINPVVYDVTTAIDEGSRIGVTFDYINHRNAEKYIVIENTEAEDTRVYNFTAGATNFIDKEGLLPGKYTIGSMVVYENGDSYYTISERFFVIEEHREYLVAESHHQVTELNPLKSMYYTMVAIFCFIMLGFAIVETLKKDNLIIE